MISLAADSGIMSPFTLNSKLYDGYHIQSSLPELADDGAEDLLGGSQVLDQRSLG